MPSAPASPELVPPLMVLQLGSAARDVPGLPGVSAGKPLELRAVGQRWEGELG